MRQEAPGSGYAAGTKIDSHRSRAELARLLTRYGASEFVVLEQDVNATIRFALHGKYVQYVLPLPDPDNGFFTHTPSGRPRALSAQERAYEQAVRQQWRRAVLVMKGKLEAVESGLSSFEREFYGAIMDDEKRDRPPALLLRRKLRWAPETMLLAICLGILVPASGGLALGVPSVAVDKLTAPLWGEQPDPFGEMSDEGSGRREAVQLGSGKAVFAAAPSRGTDVALRLDGPSGGEKQGSAPSHGSGSTKASKPARGKGGQSGGSSAGSPGAPGPSGGNGEGSGPTASPPPTSNAGGSGGGSGATASPPPSSNTGGSGGSAPAPSDGPKNPLQGIGAQGKGKGWETGINGDGSGGAAGGHKK